MSSPSSGFEAGRNSANHLVVRISKPPFGTYLICTVLGIFLIGFILFAVFRLGAGPEGIPWHIIAGAVVFAGIGIALALRAGVNSRVTITVDQSSSNVIVEGKQARLELPMRNIVAAEFVSTRSDEGTSFYQLVFLHRTGERVTAPSSDVSFPYRKDDCESAAHAINEEIGSHGGKV